MLINLKIVCAYLCLVSADTVVTSWPLTQEVAGSNNLFKNCIFITEIVEFIEEKLWKIQLFKTKLTNMNCCKHDLKQLMIHFRLCVLSLPPRGHHA